MMNRFFKLCSASLLTVFAAGSSIAQTSEYTQIIHRFEQWKSGQVNAGRFASSSNCNPDSVTKPGYKGPEMGIPKDLNICYTDINADGRLDALVTFSPDQCDGGNAMMYAQSRVIILSKGNSYTIDDTSLDTIEKQLKKGWLRFESALQGTLYGTYYEFTSSDGRCCPGIHRAFEINYSSKKISYPGR